MSKNVSPKKGENNPKKPPTPEIQESKPAHSKRNSDQQELNPIEGNPALNQSEHVPKQEEEEAIPEDKDELIEFLKNKLFKTQETIQEAFGVLEEEKEMTGHLTEDFESKRKELEKIQQNQNRPIRERVHEKVEISLQKVVSEKVNAEAKNNEIKGFISEREMLKKELEWCLKGLQIENTEKEYELQELRDKLKEQQRLLDGLTNKKNGMEEEGINQDDQIKNLLKERDDAKGAILKLSDVRNVLNRLLGDPNALYHNDGESRDKEQVQKETHSQPLQAQTSKPSYLANDEDFWFGDPSKQAYAKDFGGKEKNYNQRYQYNAKLANGQQGLGNSAVQGYENQETAPKGFSPGSSMRNSKKKFH